MSPSSIPLRSVPSQKGYNWHRSRLTVIWGLIRVWFTSILISFLISSSFASLWDPILLFSFLLGHLYLCIFLRVSFLDGLFLLFICLLHLRSPHCWDLKRDATRKVTRLEDSNKTLRMGGITVLEVYVFYSLHFLYNYYHHSLYFIFLGLNYAEELLCKTQLTAPFGLLFSSLSPMGLGQAKHWLYDAVRFYDCNSNATELSNPPFCEGKRRYKTAESDTRVTVESRHECFLECGLTA